MKDYETCADAREEFSALLDGELDVDAHDGVERHLAECSDCLRELDGMKRVSDTFANMPREDAPDDLVDEIREETQPSLVKLSDSFRATRPVSFKPVLVALVILAWMALLSYLISQSAPDSSNEPPPLVDTVEPTE